MSNRKSEIVGGTATAPMPSSSTASYTASNRVSSVNGGAGLVYDAAGDVTQDPLNSYLYDAEGRLCAAMTAGPSYTGYVYDAAGTRVAKGSLTSFSCNFAANGFTPTASYVLGPGGEQVTEYAVSAGTSTWVHTNAFSGGHLQATYHDTGTYFYLGDWLGTKRVEVGASGCAAAFTSLPYGDGLTTVALPGYSSCIDATEHHFTGKERDNESGNDYFPARYYSSAMGRWLSPDWSAKREPVPYAKLDNPQSLNLYAYLKNNPLRTTDPDGHADDPCKGKSDCYVTKDDKKQQMTVTQTSTQTNLSKDASGNQISTTTRTTNSETVSTADANRGQVLGGTQTVTTTVANLSNPSQLASTTTTSRDLNPLQAVNAVGADLSKGLQSFAQPSMMDRLMDHKVGASGVVAGGAAGACALAEPCGAVVGTGALIGAGVYAAGAAIYDFATH